MKNKHYGLVIEPVAPEDFVLGSVQSLETKYGAEELVPDGDWTPYLPSTENQDTSNGDTFACVSHGTLNAVEMLAKRRFKDTKNLSDRFLAKISGTKVGQGNSPKTVADTLRHKWSVNEPEWPDVDTVEEYYADINQNLKTLAIARGAEFEFGYQYITNTPAVIKEALKRSPVCIAVTAWLEKDGKYVRVPGIQENHWPTVVKVNEDGTYLCFDSFPPFLKRVHPDACKSVAMSYYLDRKVVVEKSWRTFLKDILSWVFSTAPGIPVKPHETPQDEPKPPQPSPTPAPTSVPQSERLYEAAKKWLGKDASPSDIANDEVGCAESVCAILRQVYPDFPMLVSTIKLDEQLRKEKRFRQTTEAKAGVIIISPTIGTNIGHVGIFESADRIMSNTSANGKWLSNYSLASWIDYFGKKKGLAIRYYEPV